jgi:hypothetical protein
VGVVAAAVGVPLALLAGMWVGSLASSTVLAALPALLIVLVLPPLAVVGAQRWVGRRLDSGSPRMGAAVGAAFGLQVLMLGGAVWAGASARRLGDATLLTLVEAAVLPTAVTLVARRSTLSIPSPTGTEVRSSVP